MMWYAYGMNFRGGNLTTSAEKSGFAISVIASVPTNSQESCVAPLAAATASRMGRNTNQLASAQKKKRNDATSDLTSCGCTSTARFSRRCNAPPVTGGGA